MNTPTTATCPKCSRVVSLPVGSEPSRRARCPHCGGEFTLQEAIDFVPPAVEIAPERVVQTKMGPAPVSKSAVAQPGRAPGNQDVPDLLINPELKPGTDEPWNSPPTGGSRIAATMSNRSAGLRRGKGRRNPVAELVKLVVGGVVGLAIGYGILLWVFKVDPFDLARYLPPAIVPERLKPAGASGTGEITNRGAPVAQNGQCDSFIYALLGNSAAPIVEADTEQTHEELSVKRLV